MIDPWLLPQILDKACYDRYAESYDNFRLVKISASQLVPLSRLAYFVGRMNIPLLFNPYPDGTVNIYPAVYAPYGKSHMFKGLFMSLGTSPLLESWLNENIHRLPNCSYSTMDIQDSYQRFYNHIQEFVYPELNSRVTEVHHDNQEDGIASLTRMFAAGRTKPAFVAMSIDNVCLNAEFSLK